MTILQSAQRRYATKAFDPERKLTDEQIASLKTVLRLSPSSINYQPWHFMLATSAQAKAKLAQSCYGKQAYNAKKINDAALVILFCAKTEATIEHAMRVIDQEAQDGRYASDDVKNERESIISGYIERLNEEHPLAIQSWLDKQAYIALGNVLLAAADMEIDSLPLEGFDASTVDKLLDLSAQGYHAVVMACFGYHSDADFNVNLSKSRLSEAELFSDLD